MEVLGSEAGVKDCAEGHFISFHVYLLLWMLLSGFHGNIDDWDGTIYTSDKEGTCLERRLR